MLHAIQAEEAAELSRSASVCSKNRPRDTAHTSYFKAIVPPQWRYENATNGWAPREQSTYARWWWKVRVTIKRRH